MYGYSFFFIASLLLLDVLFLNERLGTVIKAVTKPARDLMATFMLMVKAVQHLLTVDSCDSYHNFVSSVQVFVVFIFTAFGMYQFGQVRHKIITLAHICCM